MPECQKIKNGGLDQYGAERFGGPIIAAIGKSEGLKGLSNAMRMCSDSTQCALCPLLDQSELSANVDERAHSTVHVVQGMCRRQLDSNPSFA